MARRAKAARPTSDGEERTPEVWARRCEAAAQALDPGWALNPEGAVTDGGEVRVELVRRHPSGLFSSLAFVRLQTTWHLGYSLTFTRRPVLFLGAPLVAGSRFDSRRTIERQLVSELGLKPTERPATTWSQDEWRSNTLDLVTRGLGVPEPLLAPHYLETLRPGAARLVKLFERGEVLVPRLAAAFDARPEASAGVIARVCAGVPHAVAPGKRKTPRLQPGWDQLARRLDAAEACGVDPAATLDAFTKVSAFRPLDALAIARGEHERFGVDAVLASYLPTFAQELDRLPELTSMARGMELRL